MPPRRAPRKRGQTASTATTSAAGTPAAFSVDSRNDTPATSVPHESGEEKRVAQSKKGGKRARDAIEDVIADSEEERASTGMSTRAGKRRAVSQSVYVEIPTPAKGKGKAKAVPKHFTKPESTIDDSEPDPLDGGINDIELVSSDPGDDDSDFVLEADEDKQFAQDLKKAIKLSRRSTRSNPIVDDPVVDRPIDDAWTALGEFDSTLSGGNSESDLSVWPATRSKPRRKGRQSAQSKPSTSSNQEPVMSISSGEDSDIDAMFEETFDYDFTMSKADKLFLSKKGLVGEAAIAELEARRLLKREEQKLKIKLGRRLTHAERSTVALYLHHPELKEAWTTLERDLKPTQPEKAEQPAGLKAKLLPFQQESLFWMRKQEQSNWKGGLLADEMGMGKTIQTLALLVSEGGKPNLVVAPTVAILQWRNEIEAHTENMKVAVFHGASRKKDIPKLAEYDVVLTTFAVLQAEFSKEHKGVKRKGNIVTMPSPLHRCHWNRVILDEAHNIKERATNTAKAAFELKANYKWCLSGTPLQNRVGELYSQIRFLSSDPFAYYFCKRCDCKSLHWKFSDKKACDDCGHSPMFHTCFWNNEILTPIQKNGMIGPGRDAFMKLKILLDRMMLRRTKVERADDLGLPPRTVIVRRDYFSDEEKELYMSLFSDAKRMFSTYVDSGTVLNNYSNIFSLLTRMRQMACHPDLVLKSRSSTIAEDVLEAAVCRLCNEIAEDALESKCHHVFDRECIKQYLEATVEREPCCPVCHIPISIDLEAPAIEQNEEIATKARQGILGRLNLDNWKSSSKIEALLEELTNLRMQDSTTKSIVFSQFVNFLDLIAFRLQRAGFKVCRLEGSMTPEARNATIQHFMTNVDVTVFLVSLKAGGVALNLTEASRVYLMDSWWNPAVEFQAMDRIHRLGQHRPVKAIKLVIEDSIESRIIQLQEKKSAMVEATLSSDDNAMGKLTPEDLGFLFRL